MYEIDDEIFETWSKFSQNFVINDIVCSINKTVFFKLIQLILTHKFSTYILTYQKSPTKEKEFILSSNFEFWTTTFQKMKNCEKEKGAIWMHCGKKMANFC